MSEAVMDQTEKGRKALELLEKIINDTAFPIKYEDDGYELFCMCCHAALLYDPHDDDCVYLTAKRLIEKPLLAIGTPIHITDKYFEGATGEVIGYEEANIYGEAVTYYRVVIRDGKIVMTFPPECVTAVI